MSELKRTLDSWKNCDPRSMSAMSVAAVYYAFEDAKHDIVKLHADHGTALSQLAALREELAKFDEGMRALACSLGAGGYNAETLTADQLVGKVQWGIDNIITVQEQRLADAERRNAELTGLLREVSEILWQEDDSGDIFGRIDAALNPNPEAASHER